MSSGKSHMTHSLLSLTRADGASLWSKVTGGSETLDDTIKYDSAAMSPLCLNLFICQMGWNSPTRGGGELLLWTISLIFKDDLFIFLMNYVCMCVSMWVYAITNMLYPWSLEEDDGSTGAGVKGSCEPSDRSIGNWTWVLCMSSECFDH